MNKSIYWVTFGTILLLSLCCFGCIATRAVSEKFDENKRDLFCKHIQPEMSREEIFAILTKIGDFQAKDYNGSAYLIEFKDPLRFLYFGGQTIIYFENGIYKGKVTYGSFSDFTPICTH